MTVGLTKRAASRVGVRLALTPAAGLAIVVLAGLAGCSDRGSATPARADQPQPPAGGPQSAVRVKVVRPAREHLKRLSTPQPAHVGPYERADIYAKVAGYVHSLGRAVGPGGTPLFDGGGKPRLLDIGDRVEKGQALATLWVPEMEKELELKKALTEQAEADVKKYEAERVFREAELARLEKMVRDRSIEEARLDEKRLERDAVQAAITSAQARVRVAVREAEYVEALLDYATVRAPFSGLLTRRLVDPGAFIQSAATGKAEPLFTLDRVDRLRIVASIPEAEAALVRIGQPATLRIDSAQGQQWGGKVARFADALDSGTRTMRTEVELDEPSETLRPGRFGSITILLADFPDALMLPASTLLPAGRKPAVLVVENGKARRRDVELGPGEGGRVQVIRGLTGEEQVIADGKAAVRDGQAVEISP